VLSPSSIREPSAARRTVMVLTAPILRAESVSKPMCGSSTSCAPTRTSLRSGCTGTTMPHTCPVRQHAAKQTSNRKDLERHSDGAASEVRRCDCLESHSHVGRLAAIIHPAC
jgi:hypothetical protein